MQGQGFVNDDLSEEDDEEEEIIASKPAVIAGSYLACSLFSVSHQENESRVACMIKGLSSGDKIDAKSLFKSIAVNDQEITNFEFSEDGLTIFFDIDGTDPNLVQEISIIVETEEGSTSIDSVSSKPLQESSATLTQEVDTKAIDDEVSSSIASTNKEIEELVADSLDDTVPVETQEQILDLSQKVQDDITKEEVKTQEEIAKKDAEYVTKTAEIEKDITEIEQKYAMKSVKF